MTPNSCTQENLQWFEKYDDTSTYSGNDYDDVNIYEGCNEKKKNVSWDELFNVSYEYHDLPHYAVYLPKPVRRTIMGAYSRKYGKPRRKRKVKLF